MTRTKKQIDYQIMMLGKERENIPETSGFGTPNWECIDAKINILEGTSALNDYEEFPDGDEDGQESDPVYVAAQEADEWMMGNRDEDLFDEMWANKNG